MILVVVVVVIVVVIVIVIVVVVVGVFTKAQKSTWGVHKSPVGRSQGHVGHSRTP